VKNKMSFLATVGLMLVASSAEAAGSPATVMRLTHTTPLPDITGGDFDHLAADVPNDRLYVTAEKHQSVEVFALRSGKHLASIGGFENPHSIRLVPDRHALFIADGGAGVVRILDTRTNKLVGAIPTRPGPDAAFYDAVSRNLFVVSGGESDNSPNTDIGIVSVDQRKMIGRIPSPDNNTESMAIDHATNRLFANLRGTHRIGVFDLKTRALLATWDLPGLLKNTPLTFDPATHRLFVVTRGPAMLVVIDTDSGAIVSQTPAVGVADDMTFDAHHGRIFVSGAEGLGIYRRIDRDTFEEVQRLDTKGGKTSVYVEALNRFYVIHTKNGPIDAGLETYDVLPAATGATFPAK
jgi:DNA-binding beta-propeller fold protein YncE